MSYYQTRETYLIPVTIKQNLMLDRLGPLIFLGFFNILLFFTFFIFLLQYTPLFKYTFKLLFAGVKIKHKLEAWNHQHLLMLPTGSPLLSHRMFWFLPILTNKRFSFSFSTQILFQQTRSFHFVHFSNFLTLLLLLRSLSLSLSFKIG